MKKASLVKNVLCWAIGLIAGIGLGLFLVAILDKWVLYEHCEPYELGLLSGYDCPWWHPRTWSPSLPAFGFILGPSFASVIGQHLIKEKLYSPVKALIIASIIIFIFLLILSYLFIPPIMGVIRYI